MENNNLSEPTVPNFESDISYSLALQAHSGTSFVPEKRAESTRREYAEQLRSDYELLSRYATTSEKAEILASEFERYRAGYRSHFTKWLSSRSRLVSSMITGPANFPVRRMQKRGDVAHNRLGELIHYRERALAAIKRAMHPEWRPIMTGDADAADRLRQKIAKAEAEQQQMKEANKAIRAAAKKGTEAQVFALMELGFHESVARELLKPDFCNRIGFASFTLTNNGANIRRMRDRLQHIERLAEIPDTTIQGTAATLDDCPAENRVRLTFPGRPDAETRSRLKAGGFRWAPSLGVWQAYRNYRAMELAKAIAAGE